MGTAFRANWTCTPQAVFATVNPRCLTKGNFKRAAVDLRSVEAARFHIGIGKGGTTAFAVGVDWMIRTVGGTADDATARNGVAPIVSGRSGLTTSIVKLINNGPGYAEGVNAFAVDGTGTPEAGQLYCFWGKTAIPANDAELATAEFMRCQAFGSDTITTDRNASEAHADNELVVSLAEEWLVEIAGGRIVEVLFDYGLESGATQGIAIAAWYEKLNYIEQLTI